MHRAISLLSALLVACWCNLTAYAAPGDTEYRLAPLDKLRVIVVEWQATQGTSRDWSSINGEYRIGPGGTFSLPYVGEVQATGQTTGEVADTIEKALRTKLGLSGLPEASIEISEYRPVFISGAVQKPGMYPYFPGMTVLKLSAVAGGLQSAVDAPGVDTSQALITARSTYSQLIEERVGLLAKRARLTAEIRRRESIDFPDEIRTHQAFQAIAEGETTLKKTRERQLERQLSALQDLRKLLRAQLSSLEQKKARLRKEAQLARKELATVEGLAEKGLAVTSRVRPTRQYLSLTETNIINIETEILRARQDINQAKRDAIGLANSMQADLAAELQQTSATLRLIDLKAEMARNLMAHAIVSGAPTAFADDATMPPRFEISRIEDGVSTTFSVIESARVLPGDVISVEMGLPGAIGSKSALAPLD